MMLMLLLTELTRLGVQLTIEPDGLKVDVPSWALTDELRQAMREHKAALLRFAACPYVETMDGLGTLSGNRTEQDLTLVAPPRQEAWRYKIGVVSLNDSKERFYWPRMVLLARPRDIQTTERR
jgi:tubulysin polyketide synthase-like protein